MVPLFLDSPDWTRHVMWVQNMTGLAMSCFYVSSLPLLYMYIVRNNGLYLLAYVYTLTLVLLSVVSQCPLSVCLYCSLVVNIDSDYLWELNPKLNPAQATFTKLDEITEQV